jgi:diguanylate cyclase (GGDEF)-like protein
MDRMKEKRIKEIQELIHSSRGSDLKKLQTLSRELFRNSRKAGDEEGVAYALYAQGMAFLNQMEIKQALDKLEEARKHAVLSEARETEVRSISGIGLCLMFQQNYEEALEQFLDYMRLYYEYDVETKFYAVLNNVGEIFRHLEKYDSALQYYLEAQEVCNPEDHEFLWVLKTNIANTHIKLGDADQARRFLEEAQTIGDILEGSHHAMMIQQTYGHLAHLEGDLEKAQALLNEALTIYRKQPCFAFLMEQNAVYEELYQIYLARERWAKGEELLLEALSYTKENELWPLHIQYLGLLAKHFEESHEVTKAYDTLRKFFSSQTKFEGIRQARKLRNIELRIELDQLKKEKTELHSISHMDRLTGIYNRRAMQNHFDRFLRGEFSTEGEEMVGVLLDVDYFKEYNDRYGHLEGDQCLREIAEVLTDLAEELDGNAYRYGGDEFLMMFESLPMKTCTWLADELLKRIEGLQILHGVSYVSEWISCSVGMLINKRNTFDSFDQAFQKLDEALYTAKRKGRNCVEIRVIE